MINEIEKAIVSRLRDKIPKPIKVEAFPDSPEQYPFMTPNGSIYVRYAEEDNNPPSQSMGIIKQDSTKTFIVTILHRNLRVEGGIYLYLDLVKRALRGFKPIPGCSKMWVTKAGLIDQVKGTWNYEVWFSLLVPEVEEFDEEFDIPSLGIDSGSIPPGIVSTEITAIPGL